MAGSPINMNLILLVGGGAAIGAYFTDCVGYCIGFKKSIDDLIASVIGTGGPPGGGGGCTTNADCATGQTCDAGTCITPGGGTGGCTTDADCTTGQICASGHCTTGGNVTATPDKTFYAAGSSILVTGAGFSPNEIVSCRYTSGGTLVTGGAKNATTDGAGGFTVSYPFSGGGHVTCTGQTSARMAQALINSTAPAAYARAMMTRRSYSGKFDDMIKVV